MNLPRPVYSMDSRTGVRRLEKPYMYHGSGFVLDIMAGFEWDGASVPRILWWGISKDDCGVAAALIHDVLYRYRGNLPEHWVIPRRVFTREQADELFRQVMLDEGVWWWRRKMAYLAVRWFGHLAWESNDL